MAQRKQVRRSVIAHRADDNKHFYNTYFVCTLMRCAVCTLDRLYASVSVLCIDCHRHMDRQSHISKDVFTAQKVSSKANKIKKYHFLTKQTILNRHHPLLILIQTNKLTALQSHNYFSSTFSFIFVLSFINCNYYY